MPVAHSCNFSGWIKNLQIKVMAIRAAIEAETVPRLRTVVSFAGARPGNSFYQVFGACRFLNGAKGAIQRAILYPCGYWFFLCVAKRNCP